MLGTLLYLAQGLPQGLVYYAIPMWFTANNMPTATIGAAAAAASLPWTFKFIAGFLVDRYTWLPMGRRRPWLVGSQTLIIALMLGFALLAPPVSQSTLIIGLAFAISALTAVQDVSLDALAADLTPDREKGRMNGFMFAGKLVGIAAGMGLTGYMLDTVGIRGALLLLAACFSIPALTVLLVRERPGEKLLPWTAGAASPAAEKVATQAWGSLFTGVWSNLANRTCLTIIAFCVIYGIQQALTDNGQNLMAIRQMGWSQTQISTFNSAGNIASAVFCLSLGGWLIDRVGPARIALAAALVSGALYVMPALTPGVFASDTGFFVWLAAATIPSSVTYLTMLVLVMRVAESRVAATALAIIFGTQALGMTIGGVLLAPLDAWGGVGGVLGGAAVGIVLAALLAQTLNREAGGAVSKDQLDDIAAFRDVANREATI